LRIYVTPTEVDTLRALSGKQLHSSGSVKATEQILVSYQTVGLVRGRQVCEGCRV